MVAMSEWLDVKALYGMLAREIENDSLQYIQPTIYRDIANMLSNLKGQGYDGLEAKVKDSLASLVTDIAEALLNARLAKIRNSDTINYANLTDEERYIAEAEKDMHLRFDLVLSATVNGRVKALESIALKAKTMQILVRFIKPMQAITGVDNSKYGPYDEEDVAVIPFENARKLIEQGIVIELPWLDQ
jgi:DNA replication factor GINS